MSDQPVEVPFGDDPSEQATLLLAAAEELGLGARAVATREGGFLVPQEVHDRAFGSVTEPEEEKPKPTKKAARKSATKKKG